MYGIDLNKIRHNRNLQLNVYKLNEMFTLELLESVAYSSDDTYEVVIGKSDSRKELRTLQKKVCMYLADNEIDCKISYINLDE
jgi:phosphoenolpyruvate carboxylase